LVQQLALAVGCRGAVGGALAGPGGATRLVGRRLSVRAVVDDNAGGPQDLKDQVGLSGTASRLGAQRLGDGEELLTLLGL
jgi:hypothetical protein